MDFKETGKVYSDKERIGQVMTNLISNAVKYSPHSNRIIISTERDEKWLPFAWKILVSAYPRIKRIRYLSSFTG
jgi:signal transduction histidine kinase